MAAPSPALRAFLTWADQVDHAPLHVVLRQRPTTWLQNAFEKALHHLQDEHPRAAYKAGAAYPWILAVLPKAESDLGVSLVRPPLGGGANGQVFAVEGDPDRVVKITAETNEVRGLLRLQRQAPDCVSRVHQVALLGPVGRRPDYPGDSVEGYAILRDVATPLSDEEARALMSTWTGPRVEREEVESTLRLAASGPKKLYDYDKDKENPQRVWTPQDGDERYPYHWADDAGWALNYWLHQPESARVRKGRESALAEYRAWLSWITRHFSRAEGHAHLFTDLLAASMGSGEVMEGAFSDFGTQNLGWTPGGRLVWYDLHWIGLRPEPMSEVLREVQVESGPPQLPSFTVDVTGPPFPEQLKGDAAILAAAANVLQEVGHSRWVQVTVQAEEGDLGPFEVYSDPTYPKKGILSEIIARRPGETEGYRWLARRAEFVGGQVVGEARRVPLKGPPLDPDAGTRQLRRLLARVAAPKVPLNQPLNAGRVVVLRLGLGRDSFTMLALLSERALVVQGKEIGPEEIDAVVFTDPGWEWAHSYEAIEDARRICLGVGIPLYVQDKPPAEGPNGWAQWAKDWRRTHDIGESMERVRPWQLNAEPLPLRPSGMGNGPLSLTEQRAIQKRCASGYYHDRPPIVDDYRVRERIIQKKDASCTTNHKVVPGRALMADLARIRFNVKDNMNWSAQVRKGVRPPHLVLMGIAADEIDRAENLVDPAFTVHYEDIAFPLIEMGIRRDGEGPILERHGLGHINKSGCKMCKYQGPDWYWALSVEDPVAFAEVVAWEGESKAAAARDGRPLTDARHFRGSTDLVDLVTAWREAHPEATPNQVFRNEYRACQSRYSEGQNG